MNTYSHLFSPFKLRGITVKNRIMSAPNMLFHTVDGRPTDYYIRYLEHKARGGAGIVNLGEVSVCDGGNHTPGMKSIQDNLPLFGEMAQVIHEHGALASVELTHGGFNVKSAYNENQDLMFGPVAGTNHFGTTVRAMTKADMDFVADKFAETAAFWLHAGFDTVHVHAGHGWLLAQFLSPVVNQRTDEYGGSLENRMRFPVEVFRRIREKVGPRPPIMARISGEETPNGFTVDDTIEFLSRIQEYIDLAEISTDSFTGIFATHYSPIGQNVHLAEHIKKSGRIRIPLYTVGSILSAPQAEEILAEGRADGVSMSRALIADPFLPKKAMLGIENRPCIRCLQCTDSDNRNRHMLCSVNPLIGREERLGFGDTAVTPTETPRRVLVVGGGPAGIQAAITASQRGHTVRLIEKNAELGGWLRFADFDTHKNELRALKKYLIRELNETKTEVLLGVSDTKAAIEDYKPESIIFATGSSPIVPGIKGIESAVHATKAYFEPELVRGNKIAIIGGGLIGLEIGVYLASQGREITVFEVAPEAARDADGVFRMGLFDNVNKYNIKINTNVNLEEVPQGFDTVLYATGLRKNDSDYFELANLAPQSIVVGDAYAPGKVGGAIHGGFFAALDII